MTNVQNLVASLHDPHFARQLYAYTLMLNLFNKNTVHENPFAAHDASYCLDRTEVTND